MNPSSKLEDPWAVLNAQDDKMCPAAPVQEFMAATLGSTIEFLPELGHKFSDSSRWAPQYLALYKKLVMPVPVQHKDLNLLDLPLIEEIPSDSHADFFTIILSGDGGWAGIDRQIATDIVNHGVAVIGWNTLEYLWNAKDPEIAAKDLSLVIEHYAKQFGKTKVRLIGYSLGADILSFMVSRLEPNIVKNVDRVILLAPSLSTSFEFHISDWIDSDDENAKPILPELQKLHSLAVYCVYGEEEQVSLCRLKKLKVSKIVALKGGHHFAGDFAAISRLVLE